MAKGGGWRLQVESEMPHRFKGISFRNTDEGIGIMNAIMPLHRVVEPGQAQYLYSAVTVVDIHVAVEAAVKQNISGPRSGPSPETRLRQTSRQYNRGVPLEVAMAWAIRSIFELFHAGSDGPILMGAKHA